MGIRQTLNEKPGLTTAVVGVIVVGALVYIVYNLVPKGVPGITYDWYTSDDGKSWFKSSAGQFAPIAAKDGKEAVKVHVYQCGKTKFAGFLERWDKDGKKLVEDAKAKGQLDQPGVYKMLADEHKEIKKPGDQAWVKESDTEASRSVVKVACPDGSATPVTKVYAE